MNKEVAGSCPIAMKAPETFNSLSELFLVSSSLMFFRSEGFSFPSNRKTLLFYKISMRGMLKDNEEQFKKRIFGKEAEASLEEPDVE